jgi:hypothetical protein
LIQRDIGGADVAGIDILLDTLEHRIRIDSELVDVGVFRSVRIRESRIV